MTQPSPSLPAFIHRPVRDIEDVRAIDREVRMLCLGAAHPAHRGRVEAIPAASVDQLVGRPLCKVLSKILGPYSTQQLGGFAVQQTYTRPGAYAHLRAAIDAFDGLTLGIEASIASCITDIPRFQKQNHQQEAVVYSPFGQLHPAVHIRAPRGLTWNRYARAQAPDVYLFHAESGTMDPEKAGQNRSLFLRVLQGAVASCPYDPATQLSFWDVNFDLTNSPSVPPIPGDTDTHAVLLAHTRTHPVQFIVPAVRVRKERVACRPFANNQIHKGGIVQQAESMVAVAPADWSVEAMDDHGLFVLRQGSIHSLQPGAPPRPVSHTSPMEWHAVSAFSHAVYLDHKPIIARLNGQAVQFWNFMDIRTSKGIGAGWYDQVALDAADAQLWSWLVDRFSTH